MENKVVSILQFGGPWFGVQVDVEETSFITLAMKDATTAEVAARNFAKNNHLTYKEGKCWLLTKPLVTVLQVFENWFPAKIFSDHIEFSAIQNATAENALRQAEALAKNEKLGFVTDLGSTVFSRRH